MLGAGNKGRRCLSETNRQAREVFQVGFCTSKQSGVKILPAEVDIYSEQAESAMVRLADSQGRKPLSGT